MTHVILALRFTRRAIGAAAITAGEMSLLDGRFLSPRPERVVPSALAYVEKLLDMVKPQIVAIDAPPPAEGTRGTTLVSAVEARLSERALAVVRLERSDILGAFGVTHLTDRRELRELVRILWPDVELAGGKSKPQLADAVAAAAYVETAETPPEFA